MASSPDDGGTQALALSCMAFVITLNLTPEIRQALPCRLSCIYLSPAVMLSELKMHLSSCRKCEQCLLRRTSCVYDNTCYCIRRIDITANMVSERMLRCYPSCR